MSLANLLLKGGVQDIADSTLAAGVGRKGASSIINARNTTNDVLDLIQAGSPVRRTQNDMLDILLGEEQAGRQELQAGRQNIAQLLNARKESANPFGEGPASVKDLEEMFEIMEATGAPAAGSAGTKLSLQPTPSAPTNLNIANILSQIKPEEMARIHRGNLKASHPDLSEEAIDQLVEQGGMRGGIERLGALADDQRAFNDILQGGSYRELFGNKKQLEGYRQDRADALMARQEEMMIDELIHPNAPYLNTYAQEQTQRVVAHRRLMQGDGYSEAAHTKANLTTATEAITEGVTTGNTGMGMLQASASPASNGLMGSMENTGLGGIAASIGMGAVLGGTANYAMGGEFSEGAMMGGLAGGGVAIGARAIAANREGVSGFLQRQVLGDQAGSDIAANAAAVRNMDPDAISSLGLTQRAARGMLMKDPASPGLQSRHMVIGGSMLAGVAFTGRRNDKRRGFNAHRGNRI